MDGLKRQFRAFGIGLFFAWPFALYAQLGAPAAGPSVSDRAIPLPASGRANTGSVIATQTAAPGTGVATVTSSVQVSGTLAGSVPSADGLPGGPVRLTLADAVRRGLLSNLGPVTADNSKRAARAARLQELSALLPNISANLSEAVSQVNLRAYGFQFSPPPGSNFSIPSVVGPFSYSQAQAQLSQSVFDLVSLRNWRASKESERASVLAARDTRELVVLAVGGLYLQAISSMARVASQAAQVENARAIYEQARVRKEAGTNAKIDVVRSLVELQTQQQRLSSLNADLRKQKITLARAIGIPLEHDLELTQALAPANVPRPELAVEIRNALANRPDIKAAEAQVQAAQLALAAARAERYPSASLNGYYGVLGPTPASSHGVFSVTGAVNIPVWQGGRVKGDIEAAESTLRQRQAELADQRGKVEADLRTALIELETAEGQVRVADSNRAYAAETLTEARDRFAAGVSTTVEVVQAQEQVASAENDYIASLYSYHLARLSLARATGTAEAALPALLSSQPAERGSNP